MIHIYLPAVEKAATVATEAATGSMSFHIDFQAFLSTLPVMLNGMIGGMVVMLLISGGVSLLYALGKNRKKNKNA